MEFIRAHQLNIMLALSSVCFIILVFILMANYLPKNKKKALIIIAFSAAFLLLTDRYAYIFRGQTTPLAFIMAPLCKYLVFFNVLNISYGFNEFMISIYEENHKNAKPPKIFNIIRFTILFGHLLLIISQFTNLYYSFDSSNVYHRESGYIICYAFPIITTFIQYIIILKDYKKTNKYVIIPTFLYCTLPMISSIIQLFVPGISLTNITLAGVVILLYSFTIYDANIMLKEKERTEADLRLANTIQQNECPNEFPAFPDRNEFDLFATMTPAKEVGGDFYDYFLLDDDHLALVIADVTGKGVPAALNMVKAKTLLKGIGLYINTPSIVLKLLNDSFADNNKLDIFVTVWYGVLEISTSKLKFSNAGHEDIIIYKEETGYDIYKTKHDVPIGVIKDYEYKNHEIQLEKGDKVFFHTDGVVDAINKNNKQYGINNLLRVLNMNKKNNIKKVIKEVDSDLKNYSKDCKQFDDITMLGIELCNQDNSNNKIKLKGTFNADVKEVNNVFKYFNDTLVKTIGNQEVLKYNVVIDEIFSNIVKYGYKDIDKSKDKIITIELEINEEKRLIKFIFEDNGIEFNPLSKTNPNLSSSAKDREIGGLGIYIVKETMDKVSYKYKDNKNILTIEKKY